MKKVLVLSLIAGVFAHMAVAQDGITYRPFIRGMENRGEAKVTPKFIGLIWPDGDETAFAGYAIKGDRLVPRTGP